MWSGSGKWAESGGDASKFGLTSAELLTALKKIDEMGSVSYTHLYAMKMAFRARVWLSTMSRAFLPSS